MMRIITEKKALFDCISNLAQPHPLNDLHDTDLSNFLSFLYDEIKFNQGNEMDALPKVKTASKELLKLKINEALITSSNEVMKNKLKHLVHCCEPTNLMKLCIKSILKNGLFNEPEN